MAKHVSTHAQLEEEQMEKPMNTPIVSPSNPTSKDHCNDLRNNEICM